MSQRRTLEREQMIVAFLLTALLGPLLSLGAAGGGKEEERGREGREGEGRKRREGGRGGKKGGVSWRS